MIGITYSNASDNYLLENSNTNKKIDLKEKGPHTRSGNATEINAFVDEQVISVEVTNYIGNIQVMVTGAGGTQSQNAYISNTGVCLVDISSLSNGTYHLQIILEGKAYEGEFEK